MRAILAAIVVALGSRAEGDEDPAAAIEPAPVPAVWSEGAYRRPPLLPSILFVSRNPAPGDSIIPGLGPRGRTIATGGKLLLRDSWGEVREFLRHDPFYDVADPAVSWDGKQVAFSATVAPDSAWRIWIAGQNGSGLRPVTRTDRSLDLTRWGRDARRFARYDDFDPVWLPDGTICFASTRYPQVAGDGGLASNLFVVDADGSGVRRLTSERQGAEEPTVDPRTGLIVFARWWTNRHLASDADPSGLTLDPELSVPGEHADLWHAIAIDVDGDRGRLAGGNPRVRAETMAYQPCVLADGTLLGVRASPTSLSPATPGPWIQAFPGGFAPARWVPGVPERGGMRSPVRACAPAVIQDRRILIAADLGGDFGICLTSVEAATPAEDGRPPWSGPQGIWVLADFAGTHELDPVLLAPRKRPPVFRPYSSPLSMDQPPVSLAGAYESGASFRFDCMNAFESGPVDFPTPDAPPFERDVRIQFFAALPRPGEAGGDTAVLVREADVQAGGGIHEDSMPSDLPMFEQLVSAHRTQEGGRRVLRLEDGPAHVPGFNATRFGTGTQCVGCHRGHSVLPVPDNYATALRFNASPSAKVTASSVAPGTAGERAAVDRRARGNPARVGWVADSKVGQWVRLEWQTAIEVDTLILYALQRRWPESDLNVREVEVALFRAGQPVATEKVRRELKPFGTRIPLRGTRVDALEVRPLDSTGSVLGRPRVGIAEIETRARIAVDP